MYELAAADGTLEAVLVALSSLFALLGALVARRRYSMRPPPEGDELCPTCGGPLRTRAARAAAAVARRMTLSPEDAERIVELGNCPTCEPARDTPPGRRKP